MEGMEAYYRGQAARARGDPVKVFDWEKAAMIITTEPEMEYTASLIEDYSSTAGEIWNRDGIVNEYTYLESVWATPSLNDDPCWKYSDELKSIGKNWNFETKWPPEAIKILVDAEILEEVNGEYKRKF